MSDQIEATYEPKRLFHKICNASPMHGPRIISADFMASIGYPQTDYGFHDFYVYAEPGSNVVTRLVGRPDDIPFRMWIQAIKILGNPGGAFPKFFGAPIEVSLAGSRRKYALVEMERLVEADEETRWKMRKFGERVYWVGITDFPNQPTLAEQYNLPTAFVEAAGIAQQAAFFAADGEYGFAVGGANAMIRPSTGELVLTDPIARAYRCDEDPDKRPVEVSVRKFKRNEDSGSYRTCMKRRNLIRT